MATIRVGTRDLGLSVAWRHAFVPQGSSHQATRDALFLDVGGALVPGVLDQHQGGLTAGSTCELIERYPEFVYGHLVDPWLLRRDDGQNLAASTFSPVIVTHDSPDFDSLVSTYLAQRLIEDGELPSDCRAIVEYASEVDQGRYLLADKDGRVSEARAHAVHLGYLILQHQYGRDAEGCLKAGLDLFVAFLADVRTARAALKQGPARTGADLHPGPPGTELWLNDPRWKSIVDELNEDRLRWAKDREGTATQRVMLPTDEGNDASVEVEALILERRSTSRFNKYWARAEGIVYLVCPVATDPPVASPDEAVQPRVIASIDPTWRDRGTGAAPTLRGLGYALERAECEHRATLPGGDKRAKTPRWADGSCTNADPWYDGRGDEYGIIDAPNSGSLLPYATVKQLACSRFWQTDVTGAVIVVLEIEEDGLATTSPGAGGYLKREPGGRLSALCEPWSQPVRPSRQEGLPAGFDSQVTEWVLPIDGGLRVSALSLTQRPSERATLEDLTDWARKRRDSRGPSQRVYARFELGVGNSPPHKVDRAVSSMLADASDEQARVTVRQRQVWLDGQTLVAGFSRLPAEAPAEQFSADEHVLLYSLFLDEAIRSFNERIGKCIDPALGRVHAATSLQRDFLAFQGRFSQDGVSSDPFEQALYEQVASRLKLGERMAQLEAQVDRLAELQHGEQGKQLERLLALVSVLGMLQVVFGIADDLGVVPIWKWAGAGLVLVVGAALYLWFGRSSETGVR